MADPLSQDEIDALLGDAGDLDESVSGDMDVDISGEAPRKTGTKHIGIPEIVPYRFEFTYTSPILKSRDYVYNPNPNIENDDSVTVVRNLSNYTHYLKNQKK